MLVTGHSVGLRLADRLPDARRRVRHGRDRRASPTTRRASRGRRDRPATARLVRSDRARWAALSRHFWCTLAGCPGFGSACGARTVARADTRPVRGGTEWIAGESTGRSSAPSREVGTWSIRGRSPRRSWRHHRGVEGVSAHAASCPSSARPGARAFVAQGAARQGQEDVVERRPDGQRLGQRGTGRDAASTASGTAAPASATRASTREPSTITSRAPATRATRPATTDAEPRRRARPGRRRASP